MQWIKTQLGHCYDTVAPASLPLTGSTALFTSVASCRAGLKQTSEGDAASFLDALILSVKLPSSFTDGPAAWRSVATSMNSPRVQTHLSGSSVTVLWVTQARVLHQSLGTTISRLWFFLWSCMDVRVELWRRLSSEELMLLNSGVGEDSWESLGLQGDPISPSWRRSALGFLWKEWC